MHTGYGQVLELILDDGKRAVRVACLPVLVPAPGQYLLASEGTFSPLPVPLFHTELSPQGFIAEAPETALWNPGLVLHLRGPLGRGFSRPLSAHRVALVAFDGSPARLRGLIRPALKQGAGVVLVSGSTPDDLPDDVEVQPLPALDEVLEWADYVAMDVTRQHLSQLRERMGKQRIEAQVLIRTPVPCGGIAECGVCAVQCKEAWKLACRDGPVFDWREI